MNLVDDDDKSENTLFTINGYVSPPHSPVTPIKSLEELNEAKKNTPESSPNSSMPRFSEPHNNLDSTTPANHLRSALPPKLTVNCNEPCPFPRYKRKRLTELKKLELQNFAPLNPKKRNALE